MLGGDRLDRLTLQVVTRQAGGDAFQVAHGAGMQSQRDFQVLALELVGVLRQQVLKHAEFERQEARAEHLGVELEQLLQRRMHRTGACRAWALPGRAGVAAFLAFLMFLLLWFAGCGDGIGHRSVLGWGSGPHVGRR